MGGTKVLKSLVTSRGSCAYKCMLVRTHVPM